MADSAEELYKFVRDRHDKILLARSMAQTRLGHLIAASGILITGLISIGLPQVLTVFDSPGFWPWVFGGISMAVLFAALCCFGVAVFWVLRAVSKYSLTIPYARKDSILYAIQQELDSKEVHVSLINTYLGAIEENEKDAGYVGKYLRYAMTSVAVALVATACFAVTVSVAKISASYYRHKESTNAGRDSQPTSKPTGRTDGDAPATSTRPTADTAKP